MDLRRRLMAQPFMGSSARIFKRRRSKVPWTRSLGLLISVSERSIARLLSVSKGNLRNLRAASATGCAGRGHGGGPVEYAGVPRTRAVSTGEGRRYTMALAGEGENDGERQTYARRSTNRRSNREGGQEGAPGSQGGVNGKGGVGRHCQTGRGIEEAVAKDDETIEARAELTRGAEQK